MWDGLSRLSDPFDGPEMTDWQVGSTAILGSLATLLSLLFLLFLILKEPIMRTRAFVSVTVLAVFILSAGVARAEVDFRPDSLQLQHVGFDGNGDPLFDVTPFVELTGGDDLTGQPFPVDYELFVAGVSVSLMQNNHFTEWTLCDQTQLPNNCPGACSVKITHNATAVTTAGLCVKRPSILNPPNSFCFCTAVKDLWKAENIRIRPGEECRLVVDPFDAVIEMDEDNNELVIQGPDHPIPVVSEWGMIVMVLLALTAGTVVFGWRRRRAAA